MHERIARLQQSLREKIAKQGVAAGAAVIEQEMVMRAPILDAKTAESTALDPGTLKSDLRVKMLPIDREGYAAALIGPGELSWHVAIWVEYGHRLVKGGYSKIVKIGRNAGKLRGPGREVSQVPAHPFLRPAFETAIDPAIDSCAETVRAGIAEVLL